VGEQSERHFEIPTSVVVDGWRPGRCLLHDRDVVERRSVLVDNLFESVLSIQLRSRRIDDWPLCAECHRARLRATIATVPATVVTVGYLWWLVAGAPPHSAAMTTVLGLLLVAMLLVDLVLWRRCLLPALSAGLRLSRGGKLLVIKARAGVASIEADLHRAGAQRSF
jgi:hypothetical protein